MQHETLPVPSEQNSLVYQATSTTPFHILFQVSNSPRRRTLQCADVSGNYAAVEVVRGSILQANPEKEMVVASVNLGRGKDEEYIGAVIGESIKPNYKIEHTSKGKAKATYFGKQIYCVLRHHKKHLHRLVGLYDNKYLAWASKEEEYRRRHIYTWQSTLAGGINITFPPQLEIDLWAE